MKTYYSLILAAAATGVAFGAETAYTTPVGYVTNTLKANQYNLVGVNVHSATAAAGELNSKPSTTSLQDSEANFTTSLAAGTNIIEITGTGPNAGKIQEFVSFTATTITGLPASFVSALSGNEPYRIRPASTLASIFGSANEAGLLGGTANSADLILIPNGTGGFDNFFYSTGGFTGTGWRKVGGGGTNFASEPIVYTDAIYIRRKGTTDLPLVVTGEVKADKTVIGLPQVYNYISTVFGAGVTLGNSGIGSSVLQGNANSADLVKVPNGSGGYVTYYYSNGGFTGTGWRSVGGGNTDQANVALPSGIIIQRRQAAFNTTLTSSY